MPRGDFSFSVLSVDCASSEPSRLQRRENILHPVMGEPFVDARLKRGDGSGGLAGRKAVDHGFHVGRTRACDAIFVSASRKPASLADGTTASANPA